MEQKTSWLVTAEKFYFFLKINFVSSMWSGYWWCCAELLWIERRLKFRESRIQLRTQQFGLHLRFVICWEGAWSLLKRRNLRFWLISLYNVPKKRTLLQNTVGFALFCFWSRGDDSFSGSLELLPCSRFSSWRIRYCRTECVNHGNCFESNQRSNLTWEDFLQPE